MSIGTVVFSGLLVATVLSLFVVPALYWLIKGWELGLVGRLPVQVTTPEPAEPEG